MSACLALLVPDLRHDRLMAGRKSDGMDPWLRVSAWLPPGLALGWLAVLGGLSRIVFPSQLAGIAMRAVHTTGVMPVAAIITLLLGAFLSFKAYRRE